MRSSPSNASSETLSSFTSTDTAASLVPKSLPAKDYLAALGDLQNTFGFAGGVPTPVTVPKCSKHKNSSRSKPVMAAPSDAIPKQKDWESAYGALSASYGFAGTALVIPGKPSWLQITT